MASASLAVLTEVASIHFSAHVKESSILRLINCISNDLQKLLNYFNGTNIFTPDLAPFPAVLPAKFDLYLIDEEFSTVTSALPAI